MEFKIPFTISSLDKLKKRSIYFKKYVKHKKKSAVEEYLKSADAGMAREDYLSIVYRSAVFSFVLFFVIFSTVLILINVKFALLWSFIVSFVFSAFVSFSQGMYPRVYNTRKQRNIEKNLIPALQDILVQLNSGIPLFSILINISTADYGELSSEFKKAVRRINAGMPQVDVLDELGEKNPSLYFRRALWQISNGMKAGSDISVVIKDSIKSLNEEQIIQIQNYGNKLNPSIMFYMLISVIIPALSITFLTIISSLVNLSQSITSMLFVALLVFVVIIQLMFLGVIKSMRPSLL